MAKLDAMMMTPLTRNNGRRLNFLMTKAATTAVTALIIAIRAVTRSGMLIIMTNPTHTYLINDKWSKVTLVY